MVCISNVIALSVIHQVTMESGDYTCTNDAFTGKCMWLLQIYRFCNHCNEAKLPGKTLYFSPYYMQSIDSSKALVSYIQLLAQPADCCKATPAQQIVLTNESLWHKTGAYFLLTFHKCNSIEQFGLQGSWQDWWWFQLQHALICRIPCHTSSSVVPTSPGRGKMSYWQYLQ